MIGVAFDVKNFTCCFIDTADKTAADGTVTTDRRHLSGNLDAAHLIQFGRICLRRIQVEFQTGQGNPASDGAVMAKKPLPIICIKSPPDTYVKNDLCQKRQNLPIFAEKSICYIKHKKLCAHLQINFIDIS